MTHLVRSRTLWGLAGPYEAFGFILNEMRSPWRAEQGRRGLTYILRRSLGLLYAGETLWTQNSSKQTSFKNF